MKQFSKGKMVSYSLLMIVLALGATLVAGGLRARDQAWDFGQWTADGVAEARADYEGDPSNDHLAQLVKGLCWQYQIQKDETAKPSLLTYGQELLDRAKAGAADLEQMDGDGTLGQALAVLREVGAR